MMPSDDHMGFLRPISMFNLNIVLFLSHFACLNCEWILNTLQFHVNFRVPSDRYHICDL